MKKLFILLVLLYSKAFAQPNIAKIEYWFDTDPGFDSATTVSGVGFSNDIQLQINLPENLSQGIHTMGIRSKDLNGIWSHTNFVPVNVEDSSHGKVERVEFFWDVDPGFRNGNDSVLSNPINDITNGIFSDSVSTTFPINSTHILFARSMDTRGRWSHSNYINNMTVIACNDYIQLLEQSRVSIYPSPFHDFININPQINESARVILFDETGKKIFDQLIDHKERIDMQRFESGIYFVYVWTMDNKIYETKIIKQ